MLVEVLLLVSAASTLVAATLAGAALAACDREAAALRPGRRRP